ncbi:MAG: 30S ribosomal protein S14 [Rickettsiales bacterium]|jgi:small subunit ribosomal protein S14|nr:30S ribosomal protein S14 [Rickettsiales bacterium]
MAKKSAIAKNNRRIKLVKKFSKIRENLKDIANNRNLPVDERFAAQLKLAKLNANSSKIRIRNRCNLTGRPRGYYRDFGISRIAIRDQAGFGHMPGVTKSSW